MTKVLEDRVLKAELALEDDLRPIGPFRVGEDPAFVVFGFDDEDAESGDKYVIHLRAAVLLRKGDVVQQVIVGWPEASADNF